ncbi:MAG: periplasmic heavy metal sensor [Deltaproteobacteria bacterium]|nr:periplasmic heavy metal sensor [Deltaproteobacteria bacterium]
MTHLRTTLTLGLLLLAALVDPAGARPLGGPPGMEGLPGPGGPSFLEEVFPPALLMRHQSEIGLTDAQRDKITQQMEEAQKALVAIQWEIERQSEKLAKLLSASPVDETAALAQAEQVMTAEHRLKKAHLTLLIRIKNELTPAQRDKLRQLRPRHDGGPRHRESAHDPGGP